MPPAFAAALITTLLCLPGFGAFDDLEESVRVALGELEGLGVLTGGGTTGSSWAPSR